MAGRKPDYKVSCMNVVTNARQARVGVAWHNEDGTINIKFDPFIQVPAGQDHLIKLWPYEEEKSTPINDDIPF